MKLVVANWKMNPVTAQEAQELLISVGNAIEGIKKVEVIICPPFVWLSLFAKRKAQSAKRAAIDDKRFALSARLALGAQDLFWEQKGAYTGGVSAAMLKDVGCSHVIVGHSERRIHLGETDDMVNKKTLAALRNNLVPILCVGERERTGNWSAFVAQQIEQDLRGVPVSRIGEVVIAYEPVWAIGTGTPDTPEDALSASIFIRKVVAKLFGRTKTRNLRILYGGSVNARYARPFVLQEGIDGVLVGHASLDPGEFARIVKIVSGT